MSSEKKKFERLADTLLDTAVSMGKKKDLEESPTNLSRQIRQNAILILDHVLKVLKSLLG